MRKDGPNASGSALRLLVAGAILEAVGISALALGQHIGFAGLIVLGGLMFGIGILKMNRGKNRSGQ